MKRLAVLGVVMTALLAAGASPAGATNECRGLQVCVRVHGPWVVVPARLAQPREPVVFQLSCPRGFIVGGLDAELNDRAIDVDFLGLFGSPVNPGTSTTRSVVVRGVYTGASVRTPVFRPHIGCIPAAGGGAGPVPFRRGESLVAFPPGQPTIRRVRTVRVRAGALRAIAACGAGERLISGWHAVGFYAPKAPNATLVRSVASSQVLRGDRVEARVRAGAAVGGVRTVLQVGAVCGGGS
ncbi:MAG TPA: hypothetical protein VNR59_00335 [Gaiellaceae bacterium]|nr:hypothetical protein [Gaiellaceae bacterium]HWJ45584.1 hypothetical protein [Gaiellaceae bacterium]